MTRSEPLDFNPPFLHPQYRLTEQRAPRREPVVLPNEWFEQMPGPAFGHIPIGNGDSDLTAGHPGRPIGQKIILNGRVLDSDGRGVPNTLFEIWQANAAGRYVDAADRGREPLDPNFTGAGRLLTGNDGSYRFVTIKPAAYAGPAGSAFRSAHIHVSLFGPTLASRLITQCYFEGDPLIATDHVASAIPDPRGVERLIARWDLATTEVHDDDSALGYHWDIVLRGRNQTPMEILDDRD